MSSRIEQIIGEIEEYVDSCKFQPLSTTKIVVNKEEIEELLRELRLKTPDHIKMSIGSRIKATGIYCYFHLFLLSLSSGTYTYA
jgi:hypothetical protein